MKKILLASIGGSSAGTKPISTSVLSAILKSKGHKVVFFDTTFMDLGFSLDGEVSDSVIQFKKVNWKKYNLVRDKSIDARREFMSLIEKEKPDLIAASTMSDMYLYTIEFLRLAKENFNISTIIGGVHVTLLPEEVINEDCVDAICIGEGEEALLEFVEALDGPSPTRTDIKNLWIKTNGKIIKNPLRDLIELDKLPFMDYSIYDKRQFLRPFEGKIIRSGDIQDKRGCPKKCSYCANSILNTEIYPRTKVHYYSPERFVEEAKYLKMTYKLEFFKNFSEDILVRNIDDFAKMAELYAKHVSVPFTVGVYPLSITEEKARLLKKMRCASVSVALESGNYHYRKYVLKRNYSDETFIKKIQILKDSGIRTVALNMIGLPYESRKMIFETIAVNKKAKPDLSNITCFFPFRGTPLGDLAIREHFVDTELVKKSRSDMSESILSMPQIEQDEINGIRKMCYFYLAYPKIYWPLFRLCEPDSKISNHLLKILVRFDRIKKIVCNFFKPKKS